MTIGPAHVQIGEGVDETGHGLQENQIQEGQKAETARKRKRPSSLKIAPKTEIQKEEAAVPNGASASADDSARAV